MKKLDKEIITFISSLAMSVHQGGLLICGDSLVDLTKQLSDTVEITTKILLAVQSEHAKDASKELTYNDIRVAAHLQPIDTFLQDVQQNMFNMIVLEYHESISKSVSLAQTMLTPNGYIVVIDYKPEKTTINMADDNQKWSQSSLSIVNNQEICTLTLLTPIAMRKTFRTGRGRKRRAMA